MCWSVVVVVLEQQALASRVSIFYISKSKVVHVLYRSRSYYIGVVEDKNKQLI